MYTFVHFVVILGVFMEIKYTKRHGRNVQVSLDGGKTWRTTNCATIAEAKLKCLGLTGTVKMDEYCEQLYFNDGVGSFRWKDRARGRNIVPSVYFEREGVVKNYILPAFGKRILSEITPREVESWILELKGVKFRKKLTNAYKNKIVGEFKAIMKEAVIDGFVTSNPFMGIKLYSNSDTRRTALTKDELKTIFPEDKNELIKIWGSLENAVFYLIMRDTGFRPCEIAGLSKDDFNLIKRSVVTTHEYVEFEGKIVDRIKTSKTGQKYKVGVLADSTVKLLFDYFNEIDRNYLFYTGTYKKITHLKNKVFHKVTCLYLGRDLTQYDLRHTFMTNLIGQYSKETIMELMGHTVWETCYDNRDKDTIVSQILEKLN